MIKYLTVTSIIVLSILIFGCEPAEKTQSEPQSISNSSEISAYYFHTSRRCITCETVEKVAAESFSATDIPFASVNLESESSQTLAKKFGISGQTLLLVKGDQTIDLTQIGFMNARNNPEKFKAEIQKAIAEIRG